MENINDVANSVNCKVYEENGCTITVYREFDSSGSLALEQVISMLLDILESKENILNA